MSLLIIDSRVAAEYTPTNLPAGIRMLILDPVSNGLEQIGAAVAAERDLAAIHIVSHGAPGLLRLGGIDVTLDTLAASAGVLARLGAALAPGGDLLLYGCNVGQGDTGAAFIATLARLTGADVAASTDLSGPATEGGNWQLERATGTVEAAPLADDGFGPLALITGTAGDDRLADTYEDDTIRGGAGDDDLNSTYGNDSLEGGTGNDTLSGAYFSSGNTTLAGGDGNDTLWLSRRSENYQPTPRSFTARGDGGDDTFNVLGVTRSDSVIITGGTGRDTIHFTWVETGAITVTDFAAGAGGDRIDVESVVTNHALGGGQGGNPFASGGLLSLAQAGADTTISVQQPSGLYTLLITLKNVRATALTADNFVGGFLPDGTVMPGETASGTGSGDKLEGGLFGDSLSGLAGNDNLSGNGGHDTLDGGDGDDVVYGGGGNDRQLGGNGNDTLDGGHGADTLLGGADADVLDGSMGSDSIDGGSGDDRLSAALTDASDTLRGGEGNDIIELSTYIPPYGSYVATGSIVADGGAGDDVFQLQSIRGSGTFTLTGGSGSDRYQFNEAWENSPIVITDFTAGPGGDRFDLSRLLATRAASGTFAGGNPFGSEQPTLRLIQDGTDTLLQATSGWQPDKWFTLARLQNVTAGLLTAANFVDALDPTGDPMPGDLFNGSEAGNDILGGMFDDTLAGNGGNDTLFGGGGGDSLDGGSGDDILSGGAGDDTAVGGAGNDQLTANTGSDVLDGGDGADQLSSTLAGKAHHVLRGGAGNDTFVVVTDKGIAGSTVVADGGAGADTFRLSLRTAPTAVTLSGGDGADAYLFESVDIAGTVTITDFGVDDVIDVKPLVEGHSGYHGGNPFSTASGTLRLVQQGNDTLVQHSPYGGPFITMITLRDTVAASLTAANFAGYGPDGTGIPGLKLDGSGHITGSLQDDTIIGGAGNDSLYGQGGNDVLRGGTEVNGGDWIRGGYGDDTLYGEGGDDTLAGEEGSDLLAGGDGNDSIDAWSGTDTLQGGGGDDVLYAGTNAFLDGGAGNDTLRVSMATGPDKVRTLELTGGTGRDLFDIGAESWGTLDRTPVTITDFRAGAGGDWLDFSRLSTWHEWWPDPFSQGFRWVQEGADTLLQWKLGSMQGAYQTVVILKNVVSTQITVDNYRGMTVSGYMSLDGGPGNDSITGSDWGDVLTGGLGADTMTGGLGDDLYNVSGNDVIVELAGGGTDSIQSWSSATLPLHVENGWLLATGTLTGNAGANELKSYNEGATLAGVDGNDTLIGSDHGDLLQGGTGNDSLAGEGGDDTLEAGTGSDIVSGGYGEDTLVLRGAQADYTVQLTQDGLRLVNAATNEDIMAAEVEEFVFTDGTRSVADMVAVPVGPGNDLLAGTVDDDRLNGLGGADTMEGGDGDDTYVVDQGGDIVLENHDEGIDTVEVAFTKGGRYVLPGEVEHATVTAADTVAVDLEGNALDNLLIGNGAANRLTGREGHDTLYGGAGNDTMTGGSGNDIYFVDAKGDMVVEAAGGGMDLVVVDGLASYTLGAHVDGLQFRGDTAFTGTGNALDNSLRGGKGNDKLDGAAGNDVLYATPGNDTLLGGAGNDTMAAYDTAGSVLLDGGAGTDDAQFDWNLADVRITRPLEKDVLVTHIATGTTVLARNTENFWFRDVKLSLSDVRAAVSSPGADVISGTSAGDSLEGGGGNDQLWGLGGDDFLDGGTGADKLAGGLGDDTYVVDATGDKVTELAAEGIDTVSTRLAKYTLGVHVENLAYTGTTAFAGTGNALDNVITAGFGNDTIDGAAGKDRYVIEGNSIDFQRQSPNTTDLVLVKGTQKITLRNIEEVAFSDGVKSLADLRFNVVSPGNDTLTGTDANDQMNGLAGADQLAGGKGNDTYFLDSAGDTVIELANEGIDTVNIGIAARVTYTLGENVEHAKITSTAAIHLVGNAEDNTLTGNAAANMLTGGAGNDILIGGKGNDTLEGGAGNDFYSVDAAGDKIVEAADGGYDIVETTATKTTLADNVEELRFTGKGSFTGIGNALDNVIIGGAGNDKLTGGLGADTFVIGAGNDTITDFASGTDHLVIAPKIGNGDLVIDAVATPGVSGGFSSDAELVLFTQNVSSLTTANAAKAIGSASEAYALGDTALFALHTASTTAVYLFTSKGNDAVVSANELVQIATLAGVVTDSDFAFV